MRWPNEWSIKSCLLLCGSITIAQVILAQLAQMGFDIPVLHQLAGFIFMTFIPGILLLRIFKIHDINIVESIAYSAGLSIALVMFSGAAINFLLPLVNIRQPITVYPILTTLTVEIAVLMAAAWLRDKDHAGKINENGFSLRPYANSILFLLIMLLLVILGVKLSDITGNNIILIISLLLIALVISLAAFKKFIKPEIFPLALFAIGLSLLYQTSLMSPYLVGTDIYTEYQYYQATFTNGMWNHALTNPVNSCLSVVMLGPIYSLMTGIDGICVFKAVYPILFSLVPLIMFRFMRVQIGALPAFLAVFFFMAVPTFSLEMVSLCRQQVAEIFFSLFILLLVDRRIGSLPKTVMLVIFSLSIVVSHYSLSFITLIYVALLIPLILLLRSGLFSRIWGYITSRTGGLPEQYKTANARTLPVLTLIIPAVLYWALSLTWYILIAGGINFGMLRSLWTSQSAAVATTAGNGLSATTTTHDLLIRAALGMDFFDVTWQGMLFRVVQYITQLFIIIGCFRLLLAPKSFKFRIEYVAVSALSVAMLAACVKLPNFASAFNTTRWYHVLLITLAPFFVIGGETMIQLLNYAWNKIRKYPIAALKVSPVYLQIIAVVVTVPYFIITSGILYEVTGMQETTRIEAPFSIALSSYRLDLMGNFSKSDDYAARWLALQSTNKSIVYSDTHTWKILVLNKFPGNIITLSPDSVLVNKDLMFVTQWNSTHNQLTYSLGYPGLRSHIELSDYLKSNKANQRLIIIYENGSTQVLESVN